jgi:hypothetical protein
MFFKIVKPLQDKAYGHHFSVAAFISIGYKIY